MEIFDVVQTPVHGGSIRFYVKFKDTKYCVRNSVKKVLDVEREKKLLNVETYLYFAKKVKKNKQELLKILARLKRENRTIAGYGAPAKSTTLLHYFGIGRGILDFIVDDSPFKQGLFTPGKHIPVVVAKQLYEKKPDYLLILAWNFADSIMKVHKKYEDQGGKFIIPVPQPKIVRKLKENKNLLLF